MVNVNYCIRFLPVFFQARPSTAFSTAALTRPLKSSPGPRPSTGKKPAAQRRTKRETPFYAGLQQTFVSRRSKLSRFANAADTRAAAPLISSVRVSLEHSVRMLSSRVLVCLCIAISMHRPVNNVCCMVCARIFPAVLFRLRNWTAVCGLS